jgi:RNA recognition motif-containing protein
MSLHTTERDLKSVCFLSIAIYDFLSKLFGKYGDVESVQIVYDRFSGRSRGFGFVNILIPTDHFHY